MNLYLSEGEKLNRQHKDNKVLENLLVYIFLRRKNFVLLVNEYNDVSFLLFYRTTREFFTIGNQKLPVEECNHNRN